MRDGGAPQTRLGAKVKALRRREGLSQKELADRLGISASYLNLIEHNRRPLPASLLIKLARSFQIDLESFAVEDDERVVSDLLEIFSDPMFEADSLTAAEVKEFATQTPHVARAVLALYDQYRNSRESVDSLSSQMSDAQELAGFDRSRMPSEEVSDLIQRNKNYFPDLELGAEQLWREAQLDINDMYTWLVRYLENTHLITVKVMKVSAMNGAVRRFDPNRRVLMLSEVLAPRSRNFQLAHQIGLNTQDPILDRIAEDPRLTSDESRALAKVALANYFAGAVLMPYAQFLEAAEAERYDVELLGHRFRTSFEQVCHRLTTLQRPGAEGVPFHFLRVDIAGNISKRFTNSGIRFARFSGVCPRWNVFAAFLTPGMIRTQLSRMPDGTAYFCIARTEAKGRGRFRQPYTMHAITIGCEVKHAKKLVYTDGMDLENLDTAVPVGVTCRLCERLDCEQRALPPIQHPIKVDANVRGLSFYAPVDHGREDGGLRGEDKID
jgi:predicted transcriptional regulator/transcriptional regulator with XRE-family HTH domain